MNENLPEFKRPNKVEEPSDDAEQLPYVDKKTKEALDNAIDEYVRSQENVGN